MRSLTIEHRSAERSRPVVLPRHTPARAAAEGSARKRVLSRGDSIRPGRLASRQIARRVYTVTLSSKAGPMGGSVTEGTVNDAPYTTLPQMFARSVAEYGDEPALASPKGASFIPITYRELDHQVQALAASFLHLLGVQRGELVALTCNNRAEWMLCSLAIHAIGAVDVPRAADTPAEILNAILRHAEPVVAILERASLLESARGSVPGLRAAVVIDAPAGVPVAGANGSFPVYTLADLLSAGEDFLAQHPGEIERLRETVASDDIATIIYTSGTTGAPKGVTLTHGNFMLNISNLPKLIGAERERFLSVLQPWHAYERQLQLMGLSIGGCIYYSSITRIRGDLKTVRPTIIATVPEIWVTLYKGIFQKIDAETPSRQRLVRWLIDRSLTHAQAQRVLKDQEPLTHEQGSLARATSRASARVVSAGTAPFHAAAKRVLFNQIHENMGGCLKYAIVGGGPLPEKVDEFFDAAGLPLMEGYGMTEGIVVIALRDPERRMIRTAGHIVDGMESRILDDQGRPCATGELGRLHVRGPNIMRGYYKNPERTAEVLTDDGWLITGDLARSYVDGSIRIYSRLDDTVVLTTGKNVDAAYLENELRACEWVDRAVVVGNGKPFVAAFVLPSKTHLENLAKQLSISFSELREVAHDPRVVEHYRAMAVRVTSNGQKFAPHERVRRVVLWMDDLQIGREITQTLKLRREEFNRLYATEIEKLYKDKG